MVFQVSSGHSSTFILCKNVLNLVLAITVLGFIVQSGYKLVVCLPTLRLYSFVVVLVEVGWRVAGGKTTSQDSIITGTTKGKPKKSSRIAEFTLVVLWSVGSIVLTHIVTVLFGAYLIENFEETLTFSILVASLAFIRPLVAQGPSALLTLLERLKWEEESEGKCMCVLAGAWLGAAPIPLDWDTPWQVWPLSCSIGALLSEIGASLFFLAGGLRFGTLSSRTNKFK